jgi:hypothetical protein
MKRNFASDLKSFPNNPGRKLRFFYQGGQNKPACDAKFMLSFATGEGRVFSSVAVW